MDGIRLVTESFCQLLPADKACPTIALTDGVSVVLGRGPLTLVTDKKVSRNQVEVTADFSKQELHVRQLGCNHANVGGKLLCKNESRLLGAMSTFELLEGSYKYHIHFGKRVPKDVLLKLQRNNKSTSDEEYIQEAPSSGLTRPTSEAAVSLTECKKKESVDKMCLSSRTNQNGSTGGTIHNSEVTLSDRRLSRKREHERDAEDLLVTKRSKIEKKIEDHSISTIAHSSVDAIGGEMVSTGLPQAKQRSLDKFLLAGKPTTLDESSPAGAFGQQWLEVDSILVLKHGCLVHSRKIAGFDLDGTLIETASGRRFATGPTDWKIMTKILTKLRCLHDDGYKIVIFTNQLGIAKGKPTKAEFRQKMEAIATKLQVPVLVIASTARDIHRKPYIGMWEYLTEKGNGDLDVDIGESFYVGDAAGREVKWRPGAKKDFSCGDRKFAANLNLTFHTPEEFFLDLPKCSRFSWGDFVPSSLDYTMTTPTLQPPNVLLHSDGQEVIVFVGCPASGKSTFYSAHLAPNGYCRVNRDALGSWQKCVGECTRLLSAGKSVVIDNTSPDVESRKRYLQCCQKFKVHSRCFQFMTPLAQAKHNNRFRELTMNAGGYVKVTDIAFNTYKSRFCEPQLSEGFGEIVQVSIAPNFTDKRKEKLYKLFLVE